MVGSLHCSSLQPTDFILVFSDLHVYASMFSVVLMNYIFMDGKCDYFQGNCWLERGLILPRRNIGWVQQGMAGFL